MDFLVTGQIQKTEASNSVSDPPLGVKALEHLRCSEEGDIVAGQVSSEEANVPTRNGNPLPPNTFVDKLTMEYMMNRTHYKKYLAKTDATKYNQLNDQMLYVREHQDDVQDIVNHLLDDFIRHGSFTKYNTTIIASFEEFLQSCMQYIKDDEYNQQNNDETV